MRLLSFLCFLIIVILGVSFSTLNSQLVSINYYVGNRSMALSLLLVISLSIGGLLGMMIGLWLVMKLKVKNYRLRQQLKLAEKEVENLRAIPLKD